MATHTTIDRSAVQALIRAVHLVPGWDDEPQPQELADLLHHAPDVVLLDRLDAVVRAGMGAEPACSDGDDQLRACVRNRAQTVRCDRPRLRRLIQAAGLGPNFESLADDPLFRRQTRLQLLEGLEQHVRPLVPPPPPRVQISWSGVYLDPANLPVVDVFRDGSRVATIRGARMTEVFCAVAESAGELVPWTHFVRENPDAVELDGLKRLSLLVRQGDRYRTAGVEIRRILREALAPDECDWQHPRGQAGARLVI